MLFFREISFSHGARWKALISRYIGAIPLEPKPPAAEQNALGAPLSSATVESAMIAKTGAAVRGSHLAMTDATDPLIWPLCVPRLAVALVMALGRRRVGGTRPLQRRTP
jgi:hypothetical protein